jgi:hypothetical protein
VAAQLQQLAAARGQAVSERQVHQLLMESKFRDIPELCRAILGSIASIQSIQKDVMMEIKSKLESKAKPLFLQHANLSSFFKSLQQQLIETIESIRRSEESEVRTDIQQCHLTEIMSNGNILIRKQGVLQSKLYSKENIIFYETNSVCRGSELEEPLENVVFRVVDQRLHIECQTPAAAGERREKSDSPRSESA